MNCETFSNNNIEMAFAFDISIQPCVWNYSTGFFILFNDISSKVKQERLEKTKKL